MNELLESIMSATKAGIRVKFSNDSLKKGLTVTLTKKIEETKYGWAETFTKDILKEVSFISPVEFFIHKTTKTISNLS